MCPPKTTPLSGPVRIQVGFLELLHQLGLPCPILAIASPGGLYTKPMRRKMTGIISSIYIW